MITKTLAVTSLATFWILPFSPLISIIALRRTKYDKGWTRKISVAGAVMCCIYTVSLSVAVYCLAFAALMGRS